MSVPVTLTALRLLELFEAGERRGLIHVAATESRAAALAKAVSGLSPGAPVLHLPAWDCLPGDRASPSRDLMGRRMAVLRAVLEDPARLLIGSAEALAQRLPPADAAEAVTLKVGEALEREALEVRLVAMGYVLDDRIDEAGEVAFRGGVVEVFPPDLDRPVRLDVEEGRIVGTRFYDPVTQRSTGEDEAVVLRPASEVVLAPDVARTPGIEHTLGSAYRELTTVLALMPEAAVVEEPGGAERRTRQLEVAAASGRKDLPPPKDLYLSEAAWAKLVKGRTTSSSEDEAETVPQFVLQRGAAAAFTRFVGEQLEAGRRVLLTAADARDLERMSRRVKRDLDRTVDRIETAADAGTLSAMVLEAERGFVDAARGLTLITAHDVEGSRARSGTSEHGSVAAFRGEDEAFAQDDVVVHLGHGVGVLRGLERVESAAAGDRETVAIDFAKAGRLLVPVEELAQIWRYGADEGTVTLDRLDGGRWEARRTEIEGAIAETARGLIALAEARTAVVAPKLIPPRRDYEAFVARFPYPTTTDQQSAVEVVLADLASGRPMDRLVVGDVGFGKTEVALRAAAAAALAGKQVAVVAPTTVLARQHLQSFVRRFEGLGVEVAGLSRLENAAEQARVRAGLADGSVRVVVGTHALAGEAVVFADLGLLIVDEEQRFGTAHKERLRALGEAVHVLTLSATPIPRTLQGALAGLQSLSLITTPPARRRPVRTFTAGFDPAVAKAALLREHRRGGQSFVVAPRIEDLGPLETDLRKLVPELTVRVAHGKLPPAEMDAAMVAFADGDGDVLLATNIIESGLDVPRANTMLVTRADLFGLAQLHQLRGRVGRGRAQAVFYLFTEGALEAGSPAAKRLATMAALDRLGAGFAVSARDMDIRGAGDLLGDEQAGHLKLIGVGLYQHLLGLALRTARGEPAEDWTPDIVVDAPGRLPEAYIPEADLRVNLYARLARAVEPDSVERLAEEIEDRFGPLPEEAATLLALGRLRALCRALGVARVEAGPAAIAFTLREGAAALDGLELKGERHILREATETARARLDLAVETLEARC